MTGQDFKHPLFVTIVAALVATITLLLASTPEAAVTRIVEIEIKAFKYAPRKPALHVGDVVVWKNRDIVPHTVTALDGSWDSGTIAAGGQWQTTVTAGMLTDYYCRFHPMMTAAFTVKAAPPN
jgi:plastocyanin